MTNNFQKLLHTASEGWARAQVVNVIERNEHNTVVEIMITVRTVIREGRDMPDMTYNNIPITDKALIVSVHEALDDDPIMIAEISRICG